MKIKKLIVFPESRYVNSNPGLIGLHFRKIFPIGGSICVHVALLVFKVGYQNNSYQILKREIHVKKKKGAKCVSFKVISRKFDIKQ